tara:strand:- start:231 stop:1040 length:810 start_codon:yes stop_codon:yes gene_type:complete
MILIGNCRNKLKELKDKSVQTCITSPPYWGLRDYGEEEQLGQEDHPEEFVEKLTDIFMEVHRVLKDDGTLWLNIGDTYFGAKGGHWDKGNAIHNDESGVKFRETRKAPPKHKYLKTKDLSGVPWMLALSLQKKGWYLRQDIIWQKPNPIPEAVNDRCAKSHEHIFLLTKKPKYKFNAKAIAEPTRRRTDVWTINTSSFDGAHFAVFPQEIPKMCMEAGSDKGDVVLDPFMGSGTTAYVAQRLGRKWIGIELNPEYAKIIKERVAQRELF